MFGVVLWNSNENLSAVIWCEDHRDLAILRPMAGQERLAEPPIAGDLVSFEVFEENGVREARNPRIVAMDHCPGLSAALRKAAPGTVSASSEAEKVQVTGTVVPFPAQAVANLRPGAFSEAPMTGTGR